MAARACGNILESPVRLRILTLIFRLHFSIIGKSAKTYQEEGITSMQAIGGRKNLKITSHGQKTQPGQEIEDEKKEGIQEDT